MTVILFRPHHRKWKNPPSRNGATAEAARRSTQEAGSSVSIPRKSSSLPVRREMDAGRECRLGGDIHVAGRSRHLMH